MGLPANVGAGFNIPRFPGLAGGVVRIRYKDKEIKWIWDWDSIEKDAPIVAKMFGINICQNKQGSKETGTTGVVDPNYEPVIAGGNHSRTRRRFAFKLISLGYPRPGIESAGEKILEPLIELIELESQP